VHVDDHRSNPAAVEHRRPTPFAPPHRRPGDPPRDLRQHLAAVEPPSSRREARHRAVPRVARARCSGPRRPFAPLGWAARPWPNRLFGRPRVAGRRSLWAVASGQFPARYCVGDLIVFPIVLNSRNRFKLQKFVETCRNVQNLQNKFFVNPLEPLFTVGLTKLTFAR
jgi:hypothetical protein